MIGSRANTEAEKISTTTIKVDERVCALTVFDEEFGRNVFAFHADDLEVFDWLIPEKGYDYVIEKRRREMDELS
ncbi:MAG: hypothetical protein IJH73_09195 [Lachnospiraceae bacterium]|nr:hypothetical protein [Lachnospiraceae bacterium]